MPRPSEPGVSSPDPSLLAGREDASERYFNAISMIDRADLAAEMPESDPRRPAGAPQVALLIETTLASGRDTLCGVARYVRERGPWSLLHTPGGLAEEMPGWLRQWNGQGIIARVQSTRMAEALVRTGLPIVDVLGNVPGAGLPLVQVNDEEIAQMAAEHLLELGFEHFAFIDFPDEQWSQLRRDAFLTAVSAKDKTPAVFTLARRTDMERKPWNLEMEEMAEWIRRQPKPLGVMVCSDQRGADVMEACRRAGVSVPEDVAVVGVDNDIPLCEVSNPTLSSVWPGHFRVGFEAAALLDRLMSGQKKPREPMRIAPIKLVTRRSTEVLAIEDPMVAIALRCAREHACEGISVDEIARRAGASRSVLQRRFKTAISRTLQDELIAVRIRRALELITHTDLSFPEIAERAGFKHPEYMGVVFKARLGKTPAKVRRESVGKMLVLTK